MRWRRGPPLTAHRRPRMKRVRGPLSSTGRTREPTRVADRFTGLPPSTAPAGPNSNGAPSASPTADPTTARAAR